MMQFGEYEASDNEFDDDLEFEPVHNSYNLRQQGRQTIGEYEGDEESERYFVEFPMKFPDGVIPHVFCQAEGELDREYGDVFCATVIHGTVTEEGFSVNVGRVGPTRSWGQQLILNWVAIVSNNPMMQVYQVDAGHCPHGHKSIEVECQHPKALPAGMRPCVFATAVGGNHPDSFCVTVKKVNRQRVKFTVARGTNNRWGQNVKLNVLVCVDGFMPTLKLELGSGDNGINKYEGLAFGFDLPARPIPLVMCQMQSDAQDHWKDCFACNPANVQHGHLQLNVARADNYFHSWGQQIRAHILLFL